MTTTDVSTQTEAALAAQATNDLVDPADLTVPLLKVMQSLSKEVSEGDAVPGELVNSLTGESHGMSVQIVVADAFKGRFFNDKKSGRTYVAHRQAICDWEGHPCQGKPFVDCLDAEESFKARVNSGEIQWESGPPIATTWNFVGLLLAEDGTLDDFPVRVSLMKAAVPVARNWATLLAIAPAPWDVVFELSTKDATSKRGEPFVAVKLKQVRKTTAEEKAAVVSVAEQIHAADTVVDLGDGEAAQAATVAPDAKGGLDID